MYLDKFPNQLCREIARRSRRTYLDIQTAVHEGALFACGLLGFDEARCPVQANEKASGNLTAVSENDRHDSSAGT